MCVAPTELKWSPIVSISIMLPCHLFGPTWHSSGPFPGVQPQQSETNTQTKGELISHDRRKWQT